MDPLLVLSPRRLAVDPGGEVRAQVTVRNPGELVEQYRFQILGEAARWTQVTPRDISVLPGKAEEMTVTVVFRPPTAPAAPAGEVPFGVRCVSMDRQDNCAVVEGDLVVSAVLDLSAKLGPVGAKGITKGRFRLELSNTGTLPITAKVSLVDTAELLRFAYAPIELVIEARETAAVYIQVKPRSNRIVGKPVDHPFVVSYKVPETEKAGELPATYRQRAIVRKWMIVVLLLALLAGVIVLAFQVFRPGSDPGPSLVTGRPPALGELTVTPQSPDTVLLQWTANPYATGYELHALRDGREGFVAKQPVEAGLTQFVWEQIPDSGRTCFQLVVLGAGGAESTRIPAAESDQTCTELQGATAASESVASESAVSAQASADSVAAESVAAASASSEAAAVAAASAAAAQSSADASASSAAAGSTTSAVVTGNFTPKAFWVIYYRTPVSNGLLQDAIDVQAALQAAGQIGAQLVDSTAFTMPPPFGEPLHLVLADNFPDAASALAECALRKDIPKVACTVQQPQG